jgi:hypothetical protein
MMAAPIISRRRVVLDQQTIGPWAGDKPLLHASATRHYVGNFFEEATRILTGAMPHVTDGQADICPDFSHGDRSFLEVKSVSTTSVYLFKHRIQADRRLVRSTGGRLTYVYWLHHAPAAQAKTLHDLYAMLAGSIDQVLAIPFKRLSRFLRKQPEILLRYRAFDGKKVPAYRLNRRQLLDLGASQLTVTRRVGLVCGNEVGPVTISGRGIPHLFKPLSEREKAVAGELLAELSERYLQVSLYPAPRPKHLGHMVRVAENTSPRWYQKLCAQYSAKRLGARNFHNGAPDTDIRRRFVLRALERLSAGICRHRYDFMLRHLLAGGWPAGP